MFFPHFATHRFFLVETILTNHINEILTVIGFRYCYCCALPPFSVVAGVANMCSEFSNFLRNV
jgi:hypothetical protein